MADTDWESDWPDEAEWDEIPQPSARGAGRAVDRAAIGRRRARRTAQGLDLTAARAAQEHAAAEAAFEARYASRHEDVGDDGAARGAELAEWERITAFLLAQDDALPYDTDRDPHVRAELAAEAEALAAQQAAAAEAARAETERAATERARAATLLPAAARATLVSALEDSGLVQLAARTADGDLGDVLAAGDEHAAVAADLALCRPLAAVTVAAWLRTAYEAGRAAGGQR